ncbi:MAG: hypothetical protein U9Q22_04335 [Candidatus Altiarchaeota archaeon]|nr:hypothetical protein [Candidatus Altiarchaeota archaeon]
MEKEGLKIMDLFLHSKPVGIMLRLRNSKGKYASILSKEIDCTYTHTLKILTQLNEHGLVEFEREGRIKKIGLTSGGDDVAHELEGLVRKLDKVSASEIPPEKEGEDK